MKKKILIVAGSLAVLLALSVAGLAFAQTQTPPNPNSPYGFGYGMMGRWNNSQFAPYGMGMMRAGGYGPIHDYMEEAFAEALGISEADVEAAFQNGETFWSLARQHGYTDAQIAELMLNVRNQALDKAVADGVLTQEQADWMKSHMQAAGAGGCPGMGFGYGQGRRGPAFRGNASPSN